MRKRKLTETEIREAMRIMGARGGGKRTTKLKGFAAMTPEFRKAMSRRAAAARRARRDA